MTICGAAGFVNPNTVKVNGDFNPGFGGPLRKDRLWFYGSARYLRAAAYVGGMARDVTANDPTVFRFNPDPQQRVANDATWKDAQVRLTLQANPQNKFALSWSQQTSCKCPSLMNATTSREAGGDNRWGHPQRIVTADWTSLATSRLLLEAGALYQLNKWGWFPYDDLSAAAIPLTEQNGGINYKARASGYRKNFNDTFRYRFAASYITGAHAFKVGVSNSTGSTDYENWVLNPVSYRLNNGIPNQITLRARPYHDLWKLDADVGIFAQDRWTVDRLTLSGGLRYDYKKSHFPEQHLGPSVPLLPTRNITIPRTDQLAWKDITPKMGAAYDLFGNSRTAVKVTLNKYLSGRQADGLGNPVAGLALQTTRNWTDTNANYAPDCDLTNPADNGECRAMANPNFGKAVGATVYDPETLRGWGVRGVQLGVHDERAARDRAAHLGGRRLLPAVVRQPRSRHADRQQRRRELHHDRRSRAVAQRLRHVLHHGTDRFEAAKRRRLPGLRAHRPEARALWRRVGSDRDLRQQLREAGAELQRLRRLHQYPSPAERAAPGRRELR